MHPVDRSTPSVCGIVLAAGRSERMGFNKLTAPLANHPMVWYAVQHLKEAGVSRVVAVVGFQRERVAEQLQECDALVVQGDQLGTGHAVQCALGEVQGYDLTAILFGDCPFITDDIVRSALDSHVANGNEITVTTAQLVDPRSLGRIHRDDENRIMRVEPPAPQDGRGTGSTEVFAGLSVWDTASLQSLLIDLEPHQREGRIEYDLPDAIALGAAQGRAVGSVVISGDDALAPNQPEEFEKAENYLRLKIKTRHMSNHVNIYDSSTVRIDYDVVIGRGAVLRANTSLLGNTRVGEGCEVGPDVTIEHCHLANGVQLERGFWKEESFPEGAKVRGSRMVKSKYFRRAHWEIPEEIGLIFVIMPFEPTMFARLSNVIRPVASLSGYSCITADDRKGPGDIMQDIWTDINRASLVIADISDVAPPQQDHLQPKANVWYELGLAQALNKDVILLRNAELPERNLPFDVQGLRTIFYSPASADLGVRLTDAFGALEGPAHSRD